MKRYIDEGVIPQALFQHRVAGIMCGLISNVQMMREEIDSFPVPQWAYHELSEGYTVSDALFNMENELKELRQIHREFIEYLNCKDNG